jgi:7-cyano-7-deazaguanine synthase in queuosine biosynthesis
MKKEIIVEFSGGIDSLYAAHFLADKYDRVHLLTFYKGYLHFGLKASKVNVDLLKKLHGENKYIYKIINIKDIFREMAVKTFRETSKNYGNEVAWCIPCRASMAIGSVIYALENEISEFTDGANWEQAPDGQKLLVTADNYPEFLESIKSYTEEYKVHYVPVLYDLNTRQERRDELLRLGAKIDFNSMDRKKKSLLDVFDRDFYSRVQPICLSGYFVHWKRNFFNVKEDVTPDKVVSSIKPKLDGVGREVIEKYFEDKGLNLRDILSSRN